MANERKRLYFEPTKSQVALVEKLAKREGIPKAKATAMVFAKGYDYYSKLLKI